MVFQYLEFVWIESVSMSHPGVLRIRSSANLQFCRAQLSDLGAFSRRCSSWVEARSTRDQPETILRKPGTKTPNILICKQSKAEYAMLNQAIIPALPSCPGEIALSITFSRHLIA